ncbi:MAG: histidine kinase [Betaproteobacteria bacterium]
MKDSEILSTLRERPASSVPNWQSSGLLFDACQVGSVLRAVLLVQVVMAAGSLFWQVSFSEWLARYSILTGATLPATLAWLISACSLKRPLAHLSRAWQYAVGVALGALAGAYGCAMLVFSGLLTSPPWFASALSGALLSAALVAALVLRARGMMPAATAARLSELQARIRPHFLFNTLNSAIALVRAEPARAEALLEDLSDLFRQALADAGEAGTLSEEIALAQRDLAIEQVRFGERLRIRWQLDPAANQARLPPLLLQPLVENAVLHGVEPSSDGADLEISTERHGDKVVIQISNTVPLEPKSLQQPRGHGMALSNVRDRLNLLHDVQGHFQAGLKGGVYLVRIELPT